VLEKPGPKGRDPPSGQAPTKSREDHIYQKRRTNKKRERRGDGFVRDIYSKKYTRNKEKEARERKNNTDKKI